MMEESVFRVFLLLTLHFCSCSAIQISNCLNTTYLQEYVHCGRNVVFFTSLEVYQTTRKCNKGKVGMCYRKDNSILLYNKDMYNEITITMRITPSKHCPTYTLYYLTYECLTESEALSTKPVPLPRLPRDVAAKDGGDNGTKVSSAKPPSKDKVEKDVKDGKSSASVESGGKDVSKDKVDQDMKDGKSSASVESGGKNGSKDNAEQDVKDGKSSAGVESGGKDGSKDNVEQNVKGGKSTAGVKKEGGKDGSDDDETVKKMPEDEEDSSRWAFFWNIIKKFKVL